MQLTPHERAQRRIDLSGEIKRADQAIADAESALEDKRRLVAIAEQQVKAAYDRRDVLYEEARKLGEEAKNDFLALIPETTPSIEQQAVAWFNGDDGGGDHVREG